MSGLEHRNNIKTLIDNKTEFNSDDVQLCIYDTYQQAQQIPFHAQEPMFCAMFSGKKIMHHKSLTSGKDFIPGQSFIIGAGEQVKIDFPEANLKTPTSCLTLEIDHRKINQIAETMNLQEVATETRLKPTFQLNHNAPTQSLYRRLISAFSENQDDRALFINLGITELIVRMLRDQNARKILQQAVTDPCKTGLHAVVDYIKSNVTQPMDIESLCKIACMGRSKLYGEFKKHLACTPQAYILQQRLAWAAQQIKNGGHITQISYECGFSDPSHFSRRFKQHFSISPKQYQLSK